MKTQYSSITRFTRTDALKDAQTLLDCFNLMNENHDCKIDTRVRKVHIGNTSGYRGYIIFFPKA